MLKKSKSAGLALLLLLLLALSLIGCTPAGTAETENTKYMDYTSRVLTDLEIGNVESVIEYGEDLIFGVHYPRFDRPAADQSVKQVIQSLVDDFRAENKNYKAKSPAERAVLNVDFATYEPVKGIAVVLLNESRFSPSLAHPETGVKTLYYDLVSDSPLTVEDFFGPDSLKFLSAYCDRYFRNDPAFSEAVDTDIYKQGIAPESKNYQSLLLRKTGVEVIFQAYQAFPGSMGSPSVLIPRNEAESYFPIYQPDAPATMNAIALASEQPAETKPVVLDATAGDSADAYAAEKAPTAPAGGSANQAGTPAPQTTKPKKPMVALTFDDGPHNKVTPAILDALKKVDGHATFFVLGKRATGLPNIIQRMVAEGSEVGNHSYSHPDLTRLSADKIRSQLSLTDAVIEKATGTRPRVIRPTYGAINERVKQTADRPLILWSIDTKDWKTRSSQQTVNAILNNVKDGDIILMHDIYPSTGSAAAAVIPKLAQRGFQLVTVSELLQAKGIKAGKGQVVNKGR